MTDTALLPKGIDLAIVDKAILSGGRLLRFPRCLEDQFEQDTGRQRYRELVIRAYIGIVVYNLFVIADRASAPELFVTALWVRLGFFTPLALALTWSLRWARSAFLRETIMCLGAGGLAMASIFYLMAASEQAPQIALHESFVLVVFFLTVVQRIRFWYLVPSCLTFVALHILALDLFYQYSIGEQVAINMVFGGAVIFALVASYSMEHDLRLNYLLSLRGRLQNHELDMISRRDPLTGLGNRRSLDETLADCDRDTIAPESLSVVLLDIDHFKMFNDTAGHQAGDICLRRVADTIRGALRAESDYAFRFGGEEFLVILRRTDLAAGVSIAERMRRAIEEAAIPHLALAPGSIVTASFGVASANPESGIRAAEIIASADTALYAAKRNGRNQVWPRFPSTLGADATERRSQAG